MKDIYNLESKDFSGCIEIENEKYRDKISYPGLTVRTRIFKGILKDKREAFSAPRLVLGTYCEMTGMEVPLETLRLNWFVWKNGEKPRVYTFNKIDKVYGIGVWTPFCQTEPKQVTFLNNFSLVRNEKEAEAKRKFLKEGYEANRTLPGQTEFVRTGVEKVFKEIRNQEKV